MKKNRRWIKRVCICLLIILVPIVIFNLYILIDTPTEHMIKSNNFIDYQTYNECAGYSSAYVLRSLGISVTGEDIYNSITPKNNDGTVSPDNLVEFLRREGYSVNLHSGTIYQLRHKLSRDMPVIVFVKTSPEVNYYHYIPVIGYDKEHFYAVESLRYMENVDNHYYNRVIGNDNFEEMWETGIFRKNTYITIELKN